MKNWKDYLTKKNAKITIWVVVLLTLICTAVSLWWRVPESRLREGDIVFRGTGWDVFSLTGSVWTHCGILHEENGEWYVYEAHNGVERTPWKKWIKMPYICRVMRVKGGLTEGQQTSILRRVRGLMGRRYDNQYRWSDDRLYCSELVWKGYDAADIRLSEPRDAHTFLICHIKPIRERVVKRKGIRLDEPMVPPCDLVHSNRLRRVL